MLCIQELVKKLSPQKEIIKINYRNNKSWVSEENKDLIIKKLEVYLQLQCIATKIY